MITILVLETKEKEYRFSVNDLDEAMALLLTEEPDMIRSLDWHIESCKESCECGGNVYEGGYCMSCLEEMDEREAEEKRRDKNENRYDESRGH